MNKFYRKFLKQLLAALVSIVALVLLSPLMLVLIIIIVMESPGGAFFTQKRVGRGKKHFTLYKFRTMRTDAPAEMPTHLLNDPDAFITRSGKFMRKYSLDELPQLINIIRGDMALVGPRPALWNQFDLIAERDKYSANDIRPGLTGLAQIRGRDELPIDIKAGFDGEYTKNISLSYDIKMLFGTVAVVIKAKGIKEGST